MGGRGSSERGAPAGGWLQGAASLPRLLRALALLPTVPLDVPFVGGVDGSADPILVVRKGGARAAFQHVLEA